MAEPRTIEEVIARNFAADVAGGEGIQPEDIPAVKRPLPPVGHFGYTEEDAEAVREENKRAGATLENSETIWEPNTGGTQGPVEDAAANTERAEREAAISARTASQVAGDAGPTGPTGSTGRSSRRTADKNSQQVPAAQSRSGAASKGDDGDNANNPRDESDKK